MFTYQSTLSKTQLDELILICGASHVLFKEEEKELYGSDETEDYFFFHAVLVKPAFWWNCTFNRTIKSNYRNRRA